MKAPSPKKLQINSKTAYYDLRIGPLRFIAMECLRSRTFLEIAASSNTPKRLSYEQVWDIEFPQDTYLAKMNDLWFLDGSSGGSGAQFINHSCILICSGAVFRNHLLFFSRRKIRTGEELTADYCYPVKLQRVPCHCGARRCRGTFRYILS